MKVKALLGCGSLDENTYIITDEASGLSAVIDPNFEFIKAEDAVKGLNVKYILLTHGHFDHIWSVNELKALTGAQVLIHELEYKVAANAILNMSARFTEDLTVEADKTFNDGDVIELGESKLTVCHTPGHTTGSCMFMSDEAIFSGDMLFAGSIGRTDFPTSRTEKMMASIEKIKTLADKYGDVPVYCGHGEPTTINNEIKYNPYFR